MPSLYEFEEHPLQTVIDSCDRSIASARSAVFLCGACTLFNVGLFLTRLLELWAEWPWSWWPSGVTAGLALFTLACTIWCAHSWYLVYTHRLPWIHLRQCCLHAMQARSHAAAEFHLDQINAAFDQLNKL